MKRLLKYSIFTVVAFIAYSAVTHTQLDLRMRDVNASQTTFYNSSNDKNVTDLIHHIYSNNQKTTVDTDKQYKHKLFCYILYRKHNQHDLFKSAISTQNQHTHFEADYPIEYYIYALNKIIT